MGQNGEFLPVPLASEQLRQIMALDVPPAAARILSCGKKYAEIFLAPLPSVQSEESPESDSESAVLICQPSSPAVSFTSFLWAFSS